MVNLCRECLPQWFWWLAGLLLLAVFRVWFVASNGLALHVDEAQYWYWAQHLEWGYFSKPPLIAALIAGTTSACGDSEFCVRSGSLLVYPLTTVLVFLLARRLFGTGKAWVAATLFFTLPAVSLSSMLISTDVVLIFCWALALYAFVKALDSNAWSAWLLLGVAVGLGMLGKYTMGIFLVSALCYLVWDRRLDVLRNGRAWAAVVLAAVIFAPNLWWNAQHGFPTFQHTAQIAAGSPQHWLHFDELGGFLVGQLGVCGIVLFPLFLWAGWRWEGMHKRLLLSFALPFLLIIALQALFGRANANWAAPFCVSATLLVAGWLGKLGKVFALILVPNLLLGLLIYFPAPLNALAHTDIQKRLKGWDVMGEQYWLIQQQFPQANLLSSDREVLSELAYYARPKGLEGVSWNPGNSIRHHYDLVTTLDDKQGKDFLLVTKDDPAGYASYFQQLVPVGRLHVVIVSGYALDYRVYWLQAFKGWGK